MGDSKAIKFLTRKQERKIKKDLLFILEMTKLYLSLGYDLSYAWNIALQKKHENRFQLVTEDLGNQEKGFPLKKYRVFFGVLKQLYLRGGALIPAIDTFSRVVRKDLEKDLEVHLRKVPVEANVLLLVFFVPPALLLLILPFLFSLPDL